VARKIFLPEKYEVIGQNYTQRETYSSGLYGPPSKMKLTGYVSRTGDKRNAHRIFIGKPEGRRPLGRARCSRNDNIKMDLKEIGR
jgi:hypothetical protein